MLRIRSLIPIGLVLVHGFGLTGCGNNDNDNNNATPADTSSFNRVAVFPVCRPIDPDCNTDEVTVAEIVAASTDGMTLIYTDGTLPAGRGRQIAGLGGRCLSPQNCRITLR